MPQTRRAVKLTKAERGALETFVARGKRSARPSRAPLSCCSPTTHARYGGIVPYLICSGVGRPPFQLTPKGEAFLKTHKTAWQAFLDNTDRHEAVQHFAHALKQIAEIHEARDA